MKLDNLSPLQLQEWRAMERENHKLREKIAELEEAKNHAATILPRPEFVREIARIVAHDERHGGTSSLVVLSFEQLLENKFIIGMTLFEVIFKNLTECLIASVRNCDVLGRTGSDDFAILLTRCGIEDAEKKADSIVASIKEKIDPLLGDRFTLSLTYTVSILNNRDDAKKALPGKNSVKK